MKVDAIQQDETGNGWMIHYNNRFYHVDQVWLDEMYRHQVKPYGNSPTFNNLAHAFANGADFDEIADRFLAFMGNRTTPQKESRSRGRSRAPEFSQFIKERHAQNRR
jgi:hypothetical protein